MDFFLSNIWKNVVNMKENTSLILDSLHNVMQFWKYDFENFKNK